MESSKEMTAPKSPRIETLSLYYSNSSLSKHIHPQGTNTEFIATVDTICERPFIAPSRLIIVDVHQFLIHIHSCCLKLEKQQNLTAKKN